MLFFYLVCGVAVPNNEFAILGSADQKPDEKKETIMVQNSLQIWENVLWNEADNIFTGQKNMMTFIKAGQKL